MIRWIQDRVRMEGRVGLAAGGDGITQGRVHMEDVVRIRLDGVGIRL